MSSRIPPCRTAEENALHAKGMLCIGGFSEEGGRVGVDSEGQMGHPAMMQAGCDNGKGGERVDCQISISSCWDILSARHHLSAPDYDQDPAFHHLSRGLEEIPRKANSGVRVTRPEHFHSWEAAPGFPGEVAQAFRDTDQAYWRISGPFWRSPNSGTPTWRQETFPDDMFVLPALKTSSIAMMVEGKCREAFGPTVGEWRQKKSIGRTTRFRYLRGAVRPATIPPSIRYQLLHRAASAIITLSSTTPWRLCCACSRSLQVEPCRLGPPFGGSVIINYNSGKH